MPDRYSLRLSTVAESDLAAIYEYGFKQWGERQADRYYDALLAHFELICTNPFLFVAVDEIRPGYRRSVCGSHAIYYRVGDLVVEVMAVIGRQDMSDRL
ncbi:MAG TPA: type II toxin-antitoxin system RelE/ParE family toxin [Rhizobiaceae bacterium]|nr:type II toxin-antitoxin system RelE/ParE family toxin [Rhizobiaceae bacterium]